MDDPKPPPLPPDTDPPGPWWAFIGGIIAANVVMGLGVVLTTWLFGQVDGPGAKVIFYPSIVLTPMLGGFVAAFVWRNIEPTFGMTTWGSLGIVSVGGIAAGLMFKEGSFCLIIVVPLLFLFVLMGAAIGRAVFRQGGPYVSILPLLAIALLAEPATRVEQTAVATDELLIHAPPARVWPEVCAFPRIPAPAGFWMFRLGLPYPESTTTAGNYVGADRRCNFSGGAVFKESVAECIANERLTFDILEIPPDPELLGHLSPSRGQFLLHDNGDGTTTLIGSTWYTLHVRPTWYFDWWTRHVFRAVHLRVMEDVRRRAEASAARG